MFRSLGDIIGFCNSKPVTMPDRDLYVPPEDSEVMHDIRVWRKSERKQMVDAVQDLIVQSHKMAKSKYTRSSQRAKWTRLTGQLIWYKDQILKAMTYEALIYNVDNLMRKVYADEELKNRRPFEYLPGRLPEKVGKKEGDDETGEKGENSTSEN